MRYKILFLLIFLSFSMFVLEVTIGPVKIPVREVVICIFDECTDKYDIIVDDIRLPRAFLAFFVGIALATAGAVFQGIFRNPMAEPYILGVASGASLGATISFLYFREFYILVSFLFALATLAIVYAIAKDSETNTLLLAGISLSLLLSAITSFILYLNSKEATIIIFTLMGTLSSANWDKVKISFFIPILFFTIYAFSKELNIMTLGDEQARATGVDVKKFKKIILALSTLLTSISVSLCGIIGFVGLITPHIARILFGQNFFYLLPTSALLGGMLLSLADIFARTVVKPAEMPIGIITTFFGVPFFLYLLVKVRRHG